MKVTGFWLLIWLGADAPASFMRFESRADCEAAIVKLEIEAQCAPEFDFVELGGDA